MESVQEIKSYLLHCCAEPEDVCILNGMDQTDEAHSKQYESQLTYTNVMTKLCWVVQHWSLHMCEGAAVERRPTVIHWKLV